MMTIFLMNGPIPQEEVMTTKSLVISAMTATLVLSMGLAQAADQDRTQLQDQIREQAQDRIKQQDRIYGSQLMTRQERNEYRARMRTAKTARERE